MFFCTAVRRGQFFEMTSRVCSGNLCILNLLFRQKMFCSTTVTSTRIIKVNRIYPLGTFQICLRKFSSSIENNEMQSHHLKNNRYDDTHCNDSLSDITSKKFNELACDDQTQKKIHLILMEFELFKQESVYTELSELQNKDMKELLTIDSPRGRWIFFQLLDKRERSNLIKQKIKEEKQHILMLKPKEPIKKSTDYGLYRNSIFLRINASKMDNFYNYKSLNAKLYGQEFILDLSFEEFMNRKECLNFSQEMKYLYYINRKHKTPFNVHICNVMPDSLILKSFKNKLSKESFSLITVTEKNYLDLFPKEKIMYISQAAKVQMDHYDEAAVYVIGPRFSESLRLTLGKVKRENVNLVQFPYDKYVLWAQGTKSLKLKYVTNILLEMKRTRDWNKAFKCIPPHKIKDNEYGIKVGLGKQSVTRSVLKNFSNV